MKQFPLLLVLFLVCSCVIFAQVPGASSRVPLASVLNPDGTLRLEGGAVGAIDPAGYRLVTGPGGEPRFFPESAADPDTFWDPRFVLPGADGEVKALALGGGTLYIGGSFTKIGDVITSSIATWDGASWSALGSGVNGTVDAIAVLGSDVYAAGGFTTAGGAPASHVARWDGSAWSTLGTGIIFSSPSDAVLALAADGTDLYVGGHFTNAGGTTVSHMALWDGSSWSALGTGLNNSVRTILTAGGEIYAAGYFTSAGGGSANYIAKWDGGTWSALSFGLNGPVLALASVGTDLFAGGYFTVAGSGSANHVARWDGASWSALGTGADNAVAGLAGVGSDLYAVGLFTSAGGTSVDGVARWSGGVWSAVGSGSDIGGTDRNAVVGSGSDVYVGGALSLAATAEECNLVKWNGSSWSTLPGPGAFLGMNGTVRALWGDGSEVFVGGNFSFAGEQPSALVAYWDGSAWHRYPGLNPAGTVNAIGVAGGLYVGGSDLEATTQAGGIMKWSAGVLDSSGSWVAPSGAQSDIAGTVYAILTPGAGIYVGGNFTSANGVAANNIAFWDGAVWSALGSGITGGLSPAVYALGLSAGELYVGGSFSNAGGVPASRIAKWNGAFWASIGDANGSVLALTNDNSSIYAAGLFTTIGAVPAERVARWDGSAWHPLGSGIPSGGVPRSLTWNGIDLYVGGQFSSVGGVGARNIARWNGSYWSPLGSGVDTTVYAVSQGDGGIWAGGNFTTAGGKSSYYLAGWALMNGRPVFVPPSIAFGDVTIGEALPDSVSLENFGVDSLRIDSIVTTSGAFSVSVPTLRLAAHETIACQITFAPVAVGPAAGSIIVYHDSYTSPDTIAVTGTGRAPIRIVKLRDADGSAATAGDQAPAQWHLALYRGSVAPENLVLERDSSELTAFVTVPGTYILCEADSAAPWRRVNGNLTTRDTVTLNASAITDTFINYKPNRLVIAAYADGDGQFGTTYDRFPKTWHLEIRADSLGGLLVGASESGAFASGDLLDGTYVIREADSATYLRLGAVVDGVPLAGEDSAVAVVLSAGRLASVDFVNAPAQVTALFRSVSPESLALDRDNKGKVGKRVARKPDKVEFKFALVAGASSTLTLSFSMDVAGVITRGLGKAETLAVFTGKAPPAIALPIIAGETVQVDGRGVKGKMVTVKYKWGATSAQPVASFLLNQPRLPMPNRVNLLAETFEQGGFAATGGLLVGRAKPDSLKFYGWLQALKYTDIIKSLSAKGVRHAGTAKGLNTYLTGKPVLKGLKSLPPSKFDDILLADMIALKVNIAASALGKTPPGFGELVYDDGSGHPLAGMSVKEIAQYGDSVMMGRYAGVTHVFATTAVFVSLDTVIAKINRAFEGPVDTAGFAVKLALQGTRSVRDVGCLRVQPGAVPARIVGTDAPAEELPVAATLAQNYPNPFNPATTIRFELPAPSLVTLTVYTILGQEVARLLDRAPADAGETEASFDAGRLASGVYLYRLTVEELSEDGAELPVRVVVRKMIVMR